MLKEFTCIICPRGCVIEVDIEASPAMGKSKVEDSASLETALDRALESARGMGCRRGIDYVRQEVLNPMRTIASSVKVLDGSMPLVSVRLTKPVPKARIAEVMAALRAVELRAPVEAGTIVVRAVAGTVSDLIATRCVPRAPEAENR